MQAKDTPRRDRAGGYIVAVDDLQVGDRMEWIVGPPGAGQAAFFPIVAIDEKPKTRELTIKTGLGNYTQRCRRTTLVARAARPGEPA